MDAADVPLPPGDDDFREDRAQHVGAGENGGFHPWMPQPWQMQQPWYMQQQWQQPQNKPNRPKVNTPTFWRNEPIAWFKNIEAEFRRENVTDSGTKYSLVMLHIQEDLVEQLRPILRRADTMGDPYKVLKEELIQQFAPNVLEQLNNILWCPELGGQAPSVLMRKLVGYLPEGEPAGLVFKNIFLQKLPADIRDHVAEKLCSLAARELAEYADTLWHVRNARRSTSKSVMAVTAAAPDSGEELEEAVAALNVQSKRKQPKKKPPKGNKAKEKAKELCWNHNRFGDRAWKCADPATCAWEPAEN